MSYTQITGSKRNLRLIKALRGESLTIDLGQTIVGDLTAWIKKDPNSLSYRSFEIRENRYLYLSKENTSDFYSAQTGDLIESIEGRWYFDVRVDNEEGGTVLYTGVILFSNNITGSTGIELLELPTSFIELADTPSTYGNPGQIPVMNEAGDGLVFADIASGGSSSFKDNTLHLQNIQTIKNENLTFNYNKGDSPTNIFIELPLVRQGNIKGRLNVGMLQYVDTNYDYTEIMPNILEFSTNFFDTNRWIEDAGPTLPVDPVATPLIAVTRVDGAIQIEPSLEYYGANYGRSASKDLNGPLIVEAFIDKYIESSEDGLSLGATNIKFGSVELTPGNPTLGLLVILPESNYAGLLNSFYANLLELIVIYQQDDEIIESIFSDKTDYLTMLDSTQYSSFVSREALDYFSSNNDD